MLIRHGALSESPRHATAPAADTALAPPRIPVSSPTATRPAGPAVDTLISQRLLLALPTNADTVSFYYSLSYRHHRGYRLLLLLFVLLDLWRIPSHPYYSSSYWYHRGYRLLQVGYTPKHRLQTSRESESGTNLVTATPEDYNYLHPIRIRDPTYKNPQGLSMDRSVLEFRI